MFTTALFVGRCTRSSEDPVRWHYRVFTVEDTFGSHDHQCTDRLSVLYHF
jgi:hypothetical protein